MPDLKVTDAEIDATAARLREAALPVPDSVCFDPGVTGSAEVAAALGDAEVLLGRIMTALSSVSESAATDTVQIGVALTDADANLAGAG